LCTIYLVQETLIYLIVSIKIHTNVFDFDILADEKGEVEAGIHFPTLDRMLAVSIHLVTLLICIFN